MATKAEPHMTLLFFTCSVVSDSVWPLDCSMHSSMSFTISRSFLKFMSIESVMPSNHLILCPLPLLTSIFPTIRVFSNESPLHISQSVQSLSRVWLFATPWTAACQASLSITNSWSLLKLMSIALVMPSKHLILCPLVLLPPSIFPSVSRNESVPHIRWPKYWNSSISLYNEYSGLISFKIDWLDLLAVQGTLKSLLQLHRSKQSILWFSAFSLWSNFHIHTWLLDKPYDIDIGISSQEV